MTKEEYKLEGQRRMKERKEVRNQEWRSLCKKATEIGLKPKYIKRGYWADSSSPTGYYQICTMGGFCQNPCNGDC